MQLKAGDTVAVVARLSDVPIDEPVAAPNKAKGSAAVSNEPPPIADDLTAEAADTPETPVTPVLEEEVA